jgi:hypothetical protein
MMSARKTIPSLALAALIVTLTIPVHGQTGIIVNNADALRQEGTSLDPALGSATGSVSPRIILQYANAKREERVTTPTADLLSLLAHVSPRIVLQYANAMRQAALVAPPSGMQILFSQVARRIILQYANTSRQVTLAYPVALIGDTISPQISNVQTQNVAGGIKVTWTTNEFATSEVRYGTAQGSYTQTASDPLFDKTHALTLTGLTAGQTYYFVVRGADRSGNQATSGEYQVKMQLKTYTYLPMVLRGR